jgi:hypothetical protein
MCSEVSYLHLITEFRNLVSLCGTVSLVIRGQGLGVPLSKVGFPIRKSTDQSFFAAPRSLSQRSTSFIASQRQGIHRMPLSTLDRSSHQCPPCSAQDRHGQSFLHPVSCETDDRKTSFASQDRTDDRLSPIDVWSPSAQRLPRKTRQRSTTRMSAPHMRHSCTRRT